MLNLLNSPKAELLAMYGRRRVGKTYLVKNVYKDQIKFEFTGTQNASLKNQLFKFLTWMLLNSLKSSHFLASNNKIMLRKSSKY